MTIYERQMKRLGLNLEQYSKLLQVPIEITKKLVNGEEFENMGINDFIRNNVLKKHNELENDENTALKVVEIKHESSEYQFEEEAMNWYMNEYDRDDFFKKIEVKNNIDFVRKYEFTCNVGRTKGKILSDSVYTRLFIKKIEEMGKATLPVLVKQMYDLYINYPESKERYKRKNEILGAFTNISEKRNNDIDLITWYKNFDFNDYFEHSKDKKSEVAKKLDMFSSSIYAIANKQYIPSNKILKKLKNYFDNIDNQETIEPVEEEIEVLDLPRQEEINFEDNNVQVVNEQEIRTNTQEDLLRRILITRLSQEEKELIRLFGGKVD